ncbi:MAG: formylglycine-generating enzyme family protein [Smithella sp.]
MKRQTALLLFIFFFLTILSAHAAEVKNISSKQVGNRVQITYDLIGDENEADVDVTVKVGGKDYKATELHLEGDLGKVRPGQRKTVWWNVLQDFPRGLDQNVSFDVAAGGKTFKDAATGMEMIFVKGGCFQMGDTFGDGYSQEKPVHEVCVSDFYMGKYEVTQGQWQRIMGNNPSHFSSCGANCPVENVSWNDVQGFIEKLNSRTGKRYRLPTEAEWEYAARSGGKSEKYAGGDDVDAVAWYFSNSGSRTHPVGQKQPNGLGLYDMSGNVWEWCNDWYGDKYYNQSPRDNPGGPSSGSSRVFRGGSWFNLAARTRAANRYWNFPDFRDLIRGFRLALPPGQ